MRSKPLKTTLFLAFQYLVPQHTISRWVGKLADSKISLIKNGLIRLALRHYKIDVSTAKNKDALSYESFNAFFTRTLAADPSSFFPKNGQLGSPAEGILSQHGPIKAGTLIQAKGREYTVAALLAGHHSAPVFEHGSFATIYLAPHNYHRVHAPLAGVLTDIVYVPGKLFSVNLMTANHINGLFAKNERMIFYMNTPLGKCALVMVGALLVAGIKSALAPHWTRQEMNRFQIHHLESPVALRAGDELGYFDFGSTVIMVFEKDLLMSLPTGTSVMLGQAL